MADEKPVEPRPAPPRTELPPINYRQPTGLGLGNWIWRKFIAPLFGG